ncbi:MAG: Peptidase family [Candidatus Parcubacteria bacterium]|jgi:predicted Zn-dependent protease|nr:Peptidase family [Candidatus Parcubacteria bacterium]
MHDTKIEADFVRGAEQALRELAAILESVRDIEVVIENLGQWRDPNFRQEGNILVPWWSFDWYRQDTRRNSERKKQLNAEHFLNLLRTEPWRKTIKHVDLVVLNDDLYTTDCRFIIGLALRNVGTIVSTHRFKGIADRTTRIETFKTAVLHEIGHVYGLPGKDRPSLIESLGDHCGETCVMRQGLYVPDDWIQMTRDRFEHGPFCRYCLAQLAKFIP